MKKFIPAKYGWLIVLVLLVLVNMAASFLHFRLDLTAEKRYTLSRATAKMLGQLDDDVDITVFLDGDMPAGFKKLANTSREMLQEFKERGRSHIRFRFEKPAAGLNDSLRMIFIDSLQRLGLSPMNVKAQTKEGEGQEEQYLYPGALVTSKGRAIAVDFLQGQSNMGGLNSLNNAEALLEYKLASAIRKVTRDSLPMVGYLDGNGEPLSYNVYDLIERNLKKDYVFRIFNIDSFPAIPPVFSAMLVAKPTRKFTDEQKLKIDQYVMHGGKIFWMVDNLYAEMDSLQRTQNEFIAFDRGLNLEDLFFRYGVRINLDLVQDLNCDKVPSVIGAEGGKPQIQLLQWPYFPLLSNYSNHPIAKNLDYVLSQFPNSMDTVKAEGIHKTILLATSPESRILSTPAKVTWNSIRNEEDLRSFIHASVPVAVLLEGPFSSLYANRLSQAMKDSLARSGYSFMPRSADGNKMIVVADGDIALNAVSQNEGPLQMGMNPYTKYKYANSEFVKNAVEYLTDSSGILEARSKDFTLRLLDRKKLDAGKGKWQAINIILPLLLVLFFGGMYQVMRKRRYQGG